MTQVQLPTHFSPDHEHVAIDYLAGRLSGRQAWAKAFEAFDLLDQAVFILGEEHFTFRQFYQRMR
ncbi:MAG: hypothetical protein JW850_19755 [Thermoflexales bacterium]|nr:hypothetical protein [Thermoflexales bacterium]